MKVHNAQGKLILKKYYVNIYRKICLQTKKGTVPIQEWLGPLKNDLKIFFLVKRLEIEIILKRKNRKNLG